jgi:DNA-binding CsgD family transcriptional regulator
VGALESTRLVGRDVEQRQLAHAVEAARSGRPSSVLVEGEAGIGKTRLITDAIARLTTPDDVVLVGHAVEMAGGEMPFGVVTSALRDLIRRQGLETVVAAAGPGGAPLAALVPELSTGPAPTPDRGRIIDAFTTLLLSLCRDRLTWFAVEDLHWADTSSRDQLGYFVRVMDAPAQLLVTCTLRTHDQVPSVPLATFVQELARSPAAQRVRLERLGRDAVAEHLSDLLHEPISPRLVERVVDLAEGVPFLTEELVLGGLGIDDPVPESVAAMMLTRIESLAPSARQLVQAGAVGDGQLRHTTLGAVCGLREDDLSAALTEAVQASVLNANEATDRYQFRHALLREVVSSSLLPGDRIRWNRRWAEQLDDEAAAPGHVFARIAAAHHWAATGDQDRAFAAALSAAEWADSIGAQAERAALLTRALNTWNAVGDAGTRVGIERDDLLEEVIWANMWAGTLGAACELLDAELRLIRDDADAQLRRLHLQLTRDWLGKELGDVDRERLAPTVRESIALMSDAPRSKLFVRVVTDLVSSSRDEATALSLEPLMVEAVDVVERSGTALDRFVVQNDLSHHWWLLGRQEAAVSLLLDLLPRLYDELPLSAATTWASNTVGRLAVVGRLRDAARLGADALHRAGNPELAPRLWGRLAAQLAGALLDLGRWEEADRLLSRAAVAADSHTAAWLDMYAGLLRCWSGDLRGAENLLERADQERPRGSDRSPGYHGLERCLLEAQVALAGGDLTRARAALRSIYASREFFANPDTWRVLLLAARVESDDAHRHSPRHRGLRSAPALMDEIQHVATEVIRAGDLGEVWTAQLAAERRRFDGSTDPEPWVEAVNGWARTGHVHERGWALVRLAECHLANGDQDGAREALRQAMEIGERLGAAPLVDAARAVSRRGRLGILDKPDQGTDAGQRARGLGLTAREVEVLQLIADGLSNDQIGKELFISPRTASVHVSRILTKLGVASRSEATTRAHREGLLDQT